MSSVIRFKDLVEDYLTVVDSVMLNDKELVCTDLMDELIELNPLVHVICKYFHDEDVPCLSNVTYYINMM